MEGEIVNTYEVVVTREDGWWMLAVADVDGLTQARSRNEVEAMAREYIALSLGVEPGDFDVSITYR
jgi:predicted RNase H-like HicB family nuclease